MPAPGARGAARENASHRRALAVFHDAESQARMGAFLQTLALSGWTIGRNVQVDTRWGARDAERIQRYAAELVALAPDVILAQRSRHALNADTIREMHAAFRQGGREAIDKVMRNQPAVFLKLLVLLVPRKMKVEQSRSVKEMTTEQIERGIELIKEILAQREAGANANVIEGVAEPVPALPPPSRKARRKVRRSDRADSGLAVTVPDRLLALADEVIE